MFFLKKNPGCSCCPFFVVFFELFALRSFDCEVTLEARTARHSTPAAVAKQRYSTNPERVPACSNRRRSNSCKPSASFLRASVDAKQPPGQYEAKDACGGFRPARPRCRRSNHVCVPEATGVGYHDGNAHQAFLTQSPRLPLASRRRPKCQEGIMTTAATWRIWSDVGIHWCDNNLADAKRLQSCAAQHGVQHKSRARTGRR